MGSKLGHKLRPTIERERLYHFVLGLRKDGLSYNANNREVKAERGAALSKSHVSK